jgi:hypothetical protein
VRFEGRFYRIPEADIGPKPVRPGGPTPERGRRLTLGARARRTARSRADLGDLRLGRDPREYRDLSSGGRRRRRRPRHAAGHASDEWQRVRAEPQDQRGPLVGSPEQVATDLDQAAKLGIEHIYWNTDKDPLRELSLLAQLRRG